MPTPVKKVIGVALPEKQAADIERRSSSLHISKSKYCQLVILDWLKNGGKLAIQEK